MIENHVNLNESVRFLLNPKTALCDKDNIQLFFLSSLSTSIFVHKFCNNQSFSSPKVLIMNILIRVAYI